MISPPLLSRLALAATLAALATTPALAHDTPSAPAPAPTDPAAEADVGDAITVTARHRNEKLENVPIAISTIDGKALATEHLDRVGDYAAKIPNFSALQQNTRVSGLYIRGLGGNASNDGAEGGVGLIVDNVVFTHVGFSWLDFVDLEGIEVVRGPQGTLLGKNTTIGAVIVKTQKPSFTPSLDVQGTYGARGLWQVRSNATGPLIEDKLAYRLTFATSQGGGWITNAVDGNKYLNNNRWSVRGQLLYTPAPNITDRLIAEHYETHEYNNFYPPQSDVNYNLNLDGSILSPRTGSWSNKLISRFGYTPSFNVTSNANLDNQQRLVSRTDGVSNEINIDGGAVDVTSVTAWRRLYFRPYNDGDYTPLAIDRSGYDVDVNQYSQELRFASKDGGKIDWSAGAYYLHEDLSSKLRYIFYSQASTFVIAAGTPSSVLNNVEYDKAGLLHVDSLAGFGQATAHLTSRFSVTGGIRYTDEIKRVSVVGSSFGGADLSGSAVLLATRAATLASLGGTSAAAGGNFSLAGKADRGSVAWLVNPAWKLNDNILLYASASYGEKSGAANTAASASQAAVVLTRPEKSRDYEGGIKTTWAGGRIIANLNLYNNTITDYQDTQIDPTNPGIGSYLTNVGKVRLRGFEFESSVKPVKALTLDVNAAYNDAKYLSYDNAPAPIEYQAALGGTAATLSLTGYQIRGAPRWTLQGGATYDAAIGHDLRLTAYANTSWKSRTALLNPRSVYGWQGAYALVNAGIGVKTEDGRWTATLWSKNLFNKLYANAYGAATALTPVIEILGDPRSYGITIGHKFG
jgi:iron complex outermembrane recepter protein